MTPVVFLAAFCAVMAAVAVAQLAFTAERTPVDVGTTLVLIGTAVLACVWAALDASWITTLELLVVATTGVLVAVVGVAVIVYYWKPVTNRQHDSEAVDHDHEDGAESD